MAAGRVGQPSLLRAINLRATFQLVSDDGPLPAPRVASVTGLSKPTVAQVLGQLVDAGLVCKVGRTTGGVGPSAQLYDVDPRAGWVLGLDVGHEWVRVAVATLRGEVVARRAERTKRRSAQHIIRQLRAAVDEATREADVDRSRLHQAVVGTPGVIRPGDDHVSLAPQLPGWEAPGVVAAIRAMLGVPTAFENDVNLAALGEHAHGVGRGVHDFVYLAVGTGVGMASVLGGSLHRGAMGLAGEVGYLPFGDGAAPTSGAAARWHEGAFERWVSSAAIVAAAHEAGLHALTSAEAVFDAARAGDAAAAKVVLIEAERLAMGVAAVAAVLDPELVVLGGGIGSGGGELLLEPLARVLATVSPLGPRLATSTLGPEAVLAGAVDEALRLALEQVFGADGVNPRSKDVVDQEEMPA